MEGGMDVEVIQAGGSVHGCVWSAGWSVPLARGSSGLFSGRDEVCT